jgi:hypothetical protein
MRNIKSLIIPILLLSVIMVSCKKEYLDTKPTDRVPEADVFGSVEKISLALQGTYQNLFGFAVNGNDGHDNFGQKAWDLANDLMGNDMIVHTQGYGWFNTCYQYTEFQRETAGRIPDNAWGYYYIIIGQANAILRYIDNATGAQADKERIKGEALGIRAYALYFLANYWQQTYKGNESKPGIPIPLENDGPEDHPRGTLQNVFDQITSDLNTAEALLNGKTRPSKVNIDVSVVRGFQARVALLKEDWPTAATKAAAARQGYTLMNQTQYSDTSAFSSINNPEWMWGSFIPADQATAYASFFSHMDVRTGGYAALGTQKKITKALYDQISNDDIRKTKFQAPGTGTSTSPDYNQLKFLVPVKGSWAADYLYMRAAEMYLIEAEALAKQSGQDAAARTALETLVKARYPEYSAASLSGAALLAEIYLQRRIELWGEGFSLIDIKRWKTGLNRPSGPGNHGSPNFNPNVYTLPDGDPKFIMRIPRFEIDNNTLISDADQNP